MKRVDRLIYSELVGPWLFGVAIFSALIFATAMLVRITDWIVRGIAPSTIVEITFLALPGVVVKTFGMALLLASLLAFGRLSNDSEMTALRACGASLFRVMRPVLIFGLAVATLGFALNELVVPNFATRALALTTEVRKDLDSARGEKSIAYTVTGKQGVAAQIVARDFSVVEQVLRGVTVITYGGDGRPSYYLACDELFYDGPRNWRIRGLAKLVPADFSWVSIIKEGVWPKEIEPIKITPKNILAGISEDADVFNIRQITEEIERKRQDPNTPYKTIANLEFGMYNKIAVPLGAVVFALLGAPLGIRNTRTGVGSGFALSVALSFAYLTLANLLAVYAKNGSLPSWIASFAPVLVGVAAAAVAVWRKNL